MKVALHVRFDHDLHARLVELARAEGLSLNTYLVRLVRVDVGRHQRRQRYAEQKQKI